MAVRESSTDLWVRRGLDKMAVQCVVVSDASTPSSIYALASDQGVYRSDDHGVTWSPANHGLPRDAWGRIQIQAFAVDESNPAVAFAGVSKAFAGDDVLHTGLYRTDDAGAVWLGVGQGMAGKEVQAIAVMSAVQIGAEAASAVCVASSRELDRSLDEGRTWSRLDWGGIDVQVSALAFAPGDPDTIYVGTRGAGLFRTQNGGSSWTDLNQGLDNLNVNDIAVSPLDLRLIYVATDAGLFQSTDAGTTWKMLTGATQGRCVTSIALHPQDGRVVCVGLRYGAACCSVDSGAHWTTLQRGLGDVSMLSLAMDSEDSLSLWAGTPDGIWRCAWGASVSVTLHSGIASATASPTSVMAMTPPTATRTLLAQPSTTLPSAKMRTSTLTATHTLKPTEVSASTRTSTPTATRTKPAPTPTQTFTPTSVPLPPTSAPAPSATQVPIIHTETVVPR